MQADRFDPALRKRLVSALVLAAGAIAALVLGGWAFDGLVAVAVVLMAAEWATLADLRGAPARQSLTAMVTAGAMAGLVAAALGGAQSGLVLLCLAIVAAAGLSAARRDLPASWAAGGIVYVGLPALCLVWLRLGEGGLEAVLWLFLVVW